MLISTGLSGQLILFGQPVLFGHQQKVAGTFKHFNWVCKPPIRTLFVHLCDPNQIKSGNPLENVLGVLSNQCKGSSIFFAIFPYVQSVRKGEGGGKIGDRAYVRGYLKNGDFYF